jgi:hypothetical protein
MSGMFHWIREKFGAKMISLIIGLIALVFIFFGVFSPDRMQGFHDASVAGAVNGEDISVRDFNRAYSQRVEFYRQMMGDKISDEQLRSMQLRDGVFDELVNARLMAQAAQRAGLVGSDEEVRERIRSYQAFQKEGRFDPVTYKSVLRANSLAPGGFEKLVRDEISQQSWQSYFRGRVRTSESEVQREFLMTNEKRDIKYVLLTAENGKKGLRVQQAEVDAFLKDSAKLERIKGQYELRKEQDLKGKSFDSVREALAREVLASEKTAEVQKFNDQLADELVGLLTAKGSDAAVNAKLKPLGAEVKKTGLINRLNPFIPGVGQAEELMRDSFAPDSPIASRAKKYTSGAWTLVAVIAASETADLAKLPEQRQSILQQLNFRKERSLQEAWLKQAREKAKIERNMTVIGT